MLRWSKVMRLQVECKRSPSDDFNNAKLMAGPDALGCLANKRKVGRPKSPEIEERNAEIKERFVNGETAKKIAKDKGLSIVWVYRICKGVERKVKPPRMPRVKNPEKEERNARIKERFANGEVIKKIANDEGLSVSIVYDVCKGVERKVKPIRTRDPKIEKRNARIMERYANGETLAAIGKDNDLTRQAVSLICKGNELMGKPPRKPRARDPEIEKRNAEIKERFVNGETKKEIGKDYDLSEGYISSICRGVVQKVKPIRTRNPKIEKRNAEIKERFVNGETAKKIAKDKGLSIVWVYRICKEVERKVKPKEERNARIRERFANGETLAAIGKDYDLSEGHLSLICKGVERKVKPKEERNARLRERFANGEVIKKIANDEGLSVSIVYYVCKGVVQKVKPIRTRNPKIEKRNARIGERYSNGETAKKIADREGLSVTYVYQICKGVERKVKPPRKIELEKRNAKIRERFANGETAVNIRMDYGFTRQAVYLICKGVERRVKPTKRKNPEKEARNAWIRERYAKGETAKKMAKDFDLTPPAIGYICRGVVRKVKPIRTRNPKIEKRNASIRERYSNGETAKKIAKKEILSICRVYQICKGVERKVDPRKIELEKRNARIRGRYANGENTEELAEQEGLSATYVYQICKGVERKVKHPRKIELEQRNAIIKERFADGETAKEIAKDEMLTTNHVYDICKGIERKVDPRKIELEKRNARIRKRRANGESIQKIAEKVGLAYITVYKICTDAHGS